MQALAGFVSCRNRESGNSHDRAAGPKWRVPEKATQNERELQTAMHFEEYNKTVETVKDEILLNLIVNLTLKIKFKKKTFRSILNHKENLY